MTTRDETATGKAAPRRKLGRGLGALLGEARREEPLVRLNPYLPSDDFGEREQTVAAPREGLANLSVGAIEPHPDQPRRRFDEDALAELAQSIAARGVIQPVIVRPLAGGRYQLVAGERRWRAAQKAQVHEIPAIIRELDEREVTALARIENLQREDLNPVEEARAYQRLAEQQDMTQAEIAKLVEKSRSHVANMQRLLQLPDAVLDHLETGRLDMGHARALVGAEAAVELAERAVAEGLSVREVERLVRKHKGGSSRRQARAPRDPARDADIAAVQNHLEEFLGLGVRIATDADPRSGTVTIRYRTLDQLDLVCQRLTGASI
jgi:ParB family chromosome partitioning protein